MINRLLYRLTNGLPCRLIQPADRPYLERYYVGQLFGLTFYLHRFVAGDSERHLHNHPWWHSLSLVLAGAYEEEVVQDFASDGLLIQWRKVRWWNRIDGNHFHRLLWVRPGTWTLFIHGERARIDRGQCTVEKGWGFLAPGADGRMGYTSYPPHATAPWWLTAPVGRDCRGRVPL